MDSFKVKLETKSNKFLNLFSSEIHISNNEPSRLNPKLQNM